MLVSTGSQSPEVWARLFTRAGGRLLASVLTCATPSGSTSLVVFPPLLCEPRGGCVFPTTVFARQVKINAWCFSESVEPPWCEINLSTLTLPEEVSEPPTADPGYPRDL